MDEKIYCGGNFVVIGFIFIYSIYYNSTFFDNRERLEERQKRDKLKKEYCKEKGIRLVEISYEDFDKINLDYIKEVILG